MLNGLLKLTLFAAVARWLKPRYRMLGITAIMLLAVNLAHSQYVEYVTITSNFDYLAISYLVKIVLWIAILASYYFITEVRIIVGSQQKGSSGQTPAKPVQGVGDKSTDVATDGFEFLRNKPKLESRADKIVAGKLGSGEPDGPETQS